MVRALRTELSALNLLDATSMNKTEEVWVAFTSNGRDGKHVFKNKISKDEIQSVVRFVRELGRPVGK
jgi:hypothetical protein